MAVLKYAFSTHRLFLMPHQLTVDSPVLEVPVPEPVGADVFDEVQVSSDVGVVAHRLEGPHVGPHEAVLPDHFRELRLEPS